MEEINKEYDERFYSEIILYLRGEPHDIRPGTIGAIQAEIAKKLVEHDFTLLAPENKDELLRKITTVYDRDHAIKVKLSPEDIAFAKMVVTHEDDLPSA
jgi:hypothetical protein